jgi:hypothetical protein
MITYELAKELKDAGFPHKHRYCNGAECGYMGICLDDGLNTDVCIPTLSELIEACGDEFRSLHKLNEDKWRATCTHGSHFEVYVLDHVGIGDTPEEAVAKLWLELNKK